MTHHTPRPRYPVRIEDSAPRIPEQSTQPGNTNSGKNALLLGAALFTGIIGLTGPVDNALDRIFLDKKPVPTDTPSPAEGIQSDLIIECATTSGLPGDAPSERITRAVEVCYEQIEGKDSASHPDAIAYLAGLAIEDMRPSR